MAEFAKVMGGHFEGIAKEKEQKEKPKETKYSEKALVSEEKF